MASGIQLRLLIGPTTPSPAPREVIDALTAVEVHTTAGSNSGFQLTFALSNRSKLQTEYLLSATAPTPPLRVVIVILVNSTTEVLMDGVMTHHQVTPGENGATQLIVTGEDLSWLMNRIDLSGFPFPAMPSIARVGLILAKYLTLGIVPMLVPTFLLDVESPLDHVPLQQGTDLDYIKSLASLVGHTFYIEPGPQPLTSTAYFGPEIKRGQAQPALNINMDAYSNCDSLRFQIDNSTQVQPLITIHDPIFKLPISIPIPNIGVLNPSLGRFPLVPQSIQKVTGTSNLTYTKAILRALSAASHTADAVTAEGELDVMRYGRILKARRLVGVRGAGEAFDGLYYVRKVTHRIQRGQFKQSFTLSRNALVSNIDRVPA